MKNIIFIVILFLFSCGLPDNHNEFYKPKIKKLNSIKIQYREINTYFNEHFIIEEEYEIICIEGHFYYRRSSVHNGYMAIKLDDNGKPVKCKINKEN